MQHATVETTSGQAHTATLLPPRRLNLGAGDTPLQDYENIDIKHGEAAYPLENYSDESVDEIRASHLLEHFGMDQAQDVLNEWARVLKPGGLMKIAVPNFDKIVNAYINGAGDLPLEGWLMGGHQDQHDRHGSIWNAPKLETMMRTAGLRGISSWTSEENDCASYPISLNLQGRKFSHSRLKMRTDIYAVMTRPRFIEANGADAQERLLLKTGIRMTRTGGVFWTQGISNAIERALGENPKPKYILTIDYDSVFTPDDVSELYALMETTPEANAMIPLQMRRDSIYALLTPPEVDGKPTSQLDADRVKQATMPIRSGHFGLTLIRTQAFEQMDKPWFQARPNEDGGWGEGRVDADVDFWLKLGGIYSANRVIIGHAQQVITWPSPDLTPIHQCVPDYNANGKPDGAL